MITMADGTSEEASLSVAALDITGSLDTAPRFPVKLVPRTGRAREGWRLGVGLAATTRPVNKADSLVSRIDGIELSFNTALRDTSGPGGENDFLDLGPNQSVTGQSLVNCSIEPAAFSLAFHLPMRHVAIIGGGENPESWGQPPVYATLGRNPHSGSNTAAAFLRIAESVRPGGGGPWSWN